MNGSRAAIVSSNSEVIRFLELELKLMDISVDVYAPSAVLKKHYGLLLIDTDTVADVSVYGAEGVVKISSDISAVQGSADQRLIPWPTSIERIREACMDVLMAKNSEIENVKNMTDTSNTVCVVDEQERVISVEEHRVKLSASEYRILKELCEANGRTVLRSEIMSILGAEDGNISDVYICRLRKKLETPMGRRLIFTERNVGYRTSLEWKKS